MVEENGVALGVLDVPGEIIDSSRGPSLLQVVVEPAEENLLGRQGKEILQTLTYMYMYTMYKQ